MIPTRLPTFLAKAAICGILAGARYMRARITPRLPTRFGAFVICEVPMPATTTVTPREQIRDALQFARDSRHHSSCRCFSYRDNTGAAFCSDREAIWNRAINRLLDDLR